MVKWTIYRVVNKNLLIMSHSLMTRSEESSQPISIVIGQRLGDALSIYSPVRGQFTGSALLSIRSLLFALLDSSFLSEQALLARVDISPTQISKNDKLLLNQTIG